MKKLLLISLICLMSTVVFAGDNCPSTILARHSGASWDTYGSCADWQAAGAIIQTLYYDYKSPSTSLVDGTQAGCDNFASGMGAGLAWCGGWDLLMVPNFDWSFNNTCPTISGCGPFDDDALIIPKPLANYDRMVVAVYTTGSSAPYATKFLIDTVGFNGSEYDFDESIGSGGAGNPHATFTLAVPGISAATCNGLTCDVTLSIVEPAFDGSGATGGLYGDDVTVAQNLIAGYKIVGLQSAAAPANGLRATYSLDMTTAGATVYVPATRPSAGGTLTPTVTGIDVSGSGNSLYLAYAPIFNYASGCAGNPCTTGELAAMHAISLSGSLTAQFVSAASPPIEPTPVTISSFSGSYSNIQTINLDWLTASEADAAGFYLYRSMDGNTWIQVNHDLIPATGQGGSGASYAYTDTLPKQRTYTKWYYKVEELTTNGQRAASATTTVSR